MKTVLQTYNDWLGFYMDSNSFCPYSDAEHQTANYICTIKNWDFERAEKFIRNLKNR